MEKVTFGPQTLINPKPALLIGANVDDVPNFMTAAWCGIVNSDPPMLSVAIRPHRHTYKGIRQNSTLSVNVPSAELVRETDYCGLYSGSKDDKVRSVKILYDKRGLCIISRGESRFDRKRKTGRYSYPI